MKFWMYPLHSLRIFSKSRSLSAIGPAAKTVGEGTDAPRVCLSGLLERRFDIGERFNECFLLRFLPPSGDFVHHQVEEKHRCFLLAERLGIPIFQHEPAAIFIILLQLRNPVVEFVLNALPFFPIMRLVPPSTGGKS